MILLNVLIQFPSEIIMENFHYFHGTQHLTKPVAFPLYYITPTCLETNLKMVFEKTMLYRRIYLCKTVK